jgi:SAM-dependent methyltransferase
MPDHHPEIAEDRLYLFERQEVVVHDFDATGFILDIGGGGRGVIGQLKGVQVVAIDPSARELEGAAPGPLKVIMDATDLHFLDETFGAATSFYSLMYIEETDDHKKAFAEVFRVLTCGGRFMIWEAIIPPRVDANRDIAVFPLTVKLPDEEIDAGYGVLWPEEGRDTTYYIRLAESAGFEVVSRRERGQAAYLELRKP